MSAKTRGSDGKFLYCIDFDDGDKIGPPGIPSDHVYRMEEQIRLEVEGKLERTNLPRKYFDLWDSTRDAPPPIDWYKKSMSISPCASKKKAPPGDRLGPQALKCGNIVQSPKSKCNNPSTTEKKLEAHDVLCPSLTFEELFKRSCGSCHQCSSRLACGFCGGCLHNKDATTRRLPFQVCVQKVCRRSTSKQL